METGVHGIKDPTTGTWLIECDTHGPLFAVYRSGDDDVDKEKARQLGALHLREQHQETP